MQGEYPISLNILSSPKSLPVVRAAVEQMAALEGFSKKDCHGLVLAIDEALANVIKHGYENRHDQPITINMEPQKATDGRCGIMVVVRDKGKQVDPTAISGRDLDDIRPGGLGVHLIKALMDEAEYSCPAEGGMMLRMIKFASSES